MDKFLHRNIKLMAAPEAEALRRFMPPLTRSMDLSWGCVFLEVRGEHPPLDRILQEDLERLDLGLWFENAQVLPTLPDHLPFSRLAKVAIMSLHHLGVGVTELGRDHNQGDAPIDQIAGVGVPELVEGMAVSRANPAYTLLLNLGYRWSIPRRPTIG
jgi:hypothetical protein